ncbi:MaoC/PaaZ C-terminal domain-containing protein [Corynebacterium kroppenstedtii]|uniref:MaoC/PaaZ C-terminal domain-containing protein n=1 Tax=Corynebacterium sp. PCR 32 TaxID=3351342 RepID=UPI0030AEC707
MNSPTASVHSIDMASSTSQANGRSLDMKTIVELDTIPILGDEYRKALAGFVPRPTIPGGRGSRGSGKDLASPSTAYRVNKVQINATNLAEYCGACGLRVTSAVPITYPYAVTFPLVMTAMNAPDFPFPAVGTIHLRNIIEQYSPITVTDTMDVVVYAESLRRHPKGLLIDIVTEVHPTGDDETTTWRQRSTMLSVRKTPDHLPKDDYTRLSICLPDDPTTTTRVSSSDIKKYAAVSGDKNPIHVSKLGAKLFGFPSTIAHGMWSAASLLSTVEGRVPDRARYVVEFGKPIILPASLAAYTSQHPHNNSHSYWDLRYTSAKDSSNVNVTAQLTEI